MDQDLDELSREQLVNHIIELRSAIRQHRDASLHDLCWYQPNLWDLLPERVTPEIQIPSREKFLKGCERFRDSLDSQLPLAQRIDIDFEN
jgi:hypothetical protein